MGWQNPDGVPIQFQETGLHHSFDVNALVASGANLWASRLEGRSMFHVNTGIKRIVALRIRAALLGRI